MKVILALFFGILQIFSEESKPLKIRPGLLDEGLAVSYKFTEKSSFQELAVDLGEPVRSEGSGVTWQIYALSDGSELWLFFSQPGFKSLRLVKKVLRDPLKEEIIIFRATM